MAEENAKLQVPNQDFLFEKGLVPPFVRDRTFFAYINLLKLLCLYGKGAQNIKKYFRVRRHLFLPDCPFHLNAEKKVRAVFPSVIWVRNIIFGEISICNMLARITYA